MQIQHSRLQRQLLIKSEALQRIVRASCPQETRSNGYRNHHGQLHSNPKGKKSSAPAVLSSATEWEPAVLPPWLHPRVNTRFTHSAATVGRGVGPPARVGTRDSIHIAPAAHRLSVRILFVRGRRPPSCIVHDCSRLASSPLQQQRWSRGRCGSKEEANRLQPWT